MPYQSTKILFQAGDATKYFQAADQQLPHKALIACRVSPDQRRDRSPSLAEQERTVRLAAALAGCTVLAIVQMKLSGWDALWWEQLKWQADQSGADAIWFAELTRACRNVNKMRLPTETDLQRMRQVLGEIKLVTVCPPSATMKEIIAWRKTSPQKFDKAQRQIWAKRMRKAGATYREIIAVFDVNQTTVQRWTKTP